MFVFPLDVPTGDAVEALGPGHAGGSGWTHRPGGPGGSPPPGESRRASAAGYSHRPRAAGEPRRSNKTYGALESKNIGNKGNTET